MIYPEDFERQIGFDQLRSMLAEACLSKSGARHIDRLAFLTDKTAIEKSLNETHEFTRIMETGEHFPTDHFIDADHLLDRAAIRGNYLDGTEFLDLRRGMDTILATKKFLLKDNRYPALRLLTEGVRFDPTLPKSIDDIIDDSGSVRDSASPALKKIRQAIRNSESALRSLGNKLFREAVDNGFVPENMQPTIRDGRMVIPVHAESKRKVKGFIHDESATGQTVFIEPAALLELNNELRDLTHEAHREEIRLLIDLTASLAAHLPDLREGFSYLAELDAIRAKALTARKYEGRYPKLAETPALKWFNARHPLLYLALKGKREVVPLTIELTEQDHMLLVSGPNAGGKSVSLKTVGILQYMLQCGLLVPVDEHSIFGLFDQVFVDIGDQQSIENDLSTYSSHLLNMSYFLHNATSRTLVLMDELGSGTDPNVGGAIAQAVLTGLLNRKAWGLATTHYYALKVYASATTGIRNASMRFDEERLEPRFILDIGKPGSSYAFAIAKKTGLPDDTITLARELAGQEVTTMEDVLQELDRQRTLVERKLTELTEKERKLEASLKRYQELTADLDSRKSEIIGKAKAEASALLSSTNREIERTIRHIRENRAERKETKKVRKNLQELTQSLATPDKKVVPKKVISEGDHVRIIGQSGSGVVLSLKGDQAVVQFGELRTTVKKQHLEPATASTVQSRIPVPKGIDLATRQAQFNGTLDIRGKRAEEALPLLDDFLDNAILLGYKEVKVLHGKGEGVLRQIVRDHLRGISQIASYQDEHVDRGGAGITVIAMR